MKQLTWRASHVFMMKNFNNYAFIDSQNLNLGIRSMGWHLDYKKFRKYLHEKYKISVAYLFIGYIPENHKLYSALERDGYVLKFKPVVSDKNGDFYSLVNFLYQGNRLLAVLSPYTKTCSVLLKKSAKEKMFYLDNLRTKLEFKKKSTA